jgi:superoxide reductase
MAKIGELYKSDDWKTEKHVPVIELPDGAKKDGAFPVVVSIGKEVPHPNVSEHFICWIQLFFKPESGPVYHLGRADFLAHGATTDGANSATLHTEPVACFHVKLDQPGELIATSCCNIHGLWENSQALQY